MFTFIFFSRIDYSYSSDAIFHSKYPFSLHTLTASGAFPRKQSMFWQQPFHLVSSQRRLFGDFYCIWLQYHLLLFISNESIGDRQEDSRHQTVGYRTSTLTHIAIYSRTFIAILDMRDAFKSDQSRHCQSAYSQCSARNTIDEVAA